MNVTELAVRDAVEKHTLQLPSAVESSTGPTLAYLDGIGMLLDRPNFWKTYFEDRIPYTNPIGRQKLWPVAQGASGAAILGLLGRGTLRQPTYKPHGIRWHGLGRAIEVAPRWNERYAEFGQRPMRACLVDDCIFTGNTMVDLAIAALEEGFIVEACVSAWPYTPARNERHSYRIFGKPYIIASAAQGISVIDMRSGGVKVSLTVAPPSD